MVIASDCVCGTHTICVDPSGLIRPCTTSAVVGGTMDAPGAALVSHHFAEFTSAVTARPRPSKCATCKHRDRCSVGCPASWVGNSQGVIYDHMMTMECAEAEKGVVISRDDRCIAKR
ncbi:hypothetical protein Pelo_15367 [Pelomyxa schiedti]|nr:hypothetical protein Pelo_15367 [Pelomyxa schiedti]